MPEHIRTIAAGSKPFIEIVKKDEGVTIRYCEDHEKAIRFPASMLGTLVEALRKIESE